MFWRNLINQLNGFSYGLSPSTNAPRFAIEVRAISALGNACLNALQ
jgi:hypothetical protein